MTKSELKAKIEEFIAMQNDTEKDEWWGTDRELKGIVLTEFAEVMLGIKVE